MPTRLLRDSLTITLSGLAAFVGASACGAGLAGAELVGMAGIVLGMVVAAVR